MAITDTLSDMWHGLEDRAWSLADFLEDKGIPLSSFCEGKGISPLLLFLGIIVALIIILAFVSGGGPAVGNAVLMVTIEDKAGNPVQSNFEVTYNGKTQKGETGLNGEATVEGLPHGTATVTLDSSRYKGTKTVTISSDKASVTITAQTITATLRVAVLDSASGYISSGSIDVKEFTSGRVVGSETLDGSSSYDFELPLGIYRAVVKSTSGGELDSKVEDMKEEKVYEARFTLSADAADSAAVKIAVKDENGNAIPGASVVLYNGRSEALIGSQQVTDSAGETTFHNIAIGTSVYPVVFVPNDRKYGQLDAYTSKAVYKKTVGSTQERIEVELPLNGRVEVVVWDKESQAYISGASVYIKAKSGDVLSETKQTDSEGKVSFTGFEENVEVYPVVTKTGFKDYENKEAAQPVTYGPTPRTFTVAIERDGSFIRSMITIAVRNTFGDDIDGVNAILSNVETGFVSALSDTGNISFEVDANSNYNVALFKPGYLRKVLEGIGPGTHEALLEASNPANSAHVRVCTYMNINNEASPATSTVELFFGISSALIEIGDTIGGPDGDNCITFIDLPREWSVYARATNDGYPPIETDAHQLIPAQQGITEINISFNALPPNAPLMGDIKVCVKDPNNNALTGAEVILYDFDLESPSWQGQYRLATASDGCVMFRELSTEKTDYQGVLSPVRVYPIVSASGYSTYNGKAEGNVITVQPLRTTPIEVRLSKGEGICIAVENDGKPLEGADVALCANAQCNQILETKKTEADGHAIFSSDIQSVTVKVVANIDRVLKEKIENFALGQVTKGSCGKIDLETITQYATVTLDGIAAMQIEAMPGESKELEFILRVNSEPAKGGAISSGGQSKVMADGTEVLIELTGDANAGVVRTVSAGEGKYAMPFIAPSEEGRYSINLKASIPDCDSCQGDQRSLGLVVGDGDEDDDGVLDEDDKCPRTPEDAVVDADGCPVASDQDSDGDGVTDDRDTCSGTPPGVQVDASGCPIQSVADADGDGIPDHLDAFPNDANQWIPDNDLNRDMIPDYIPQQYPQYYQNSIRICVQSDLGVPIYDAGVSLYHTGGAQPLPYGPAPTPQPGYSTRAPQYSYGPNYGQQWEMTHRSDNCRVFMGYTSMQGLGMGTFFSNFHMKVSKTGYETYDTVSGDRTSVSLASGTAGTTLTITVKLKRTGSSRMGAGSIHSPARKVELESPSWSPSDSDRRNSANIYALVNALDKDINLLVTYSLEQGTEQDLDYSIRYNLNGNNCYEVGGEADTLMGAGRTLSIRKGQSTVTDTVTIYSKSECWGTNNPALENEFTLTLDGRLLQIGDTEVSGRIASASSGSSRTAPTAVSQRFESARVRIKPLVGATKEIRGISDLPELNNALMFSDGVVTIGALPYCIDDRANTARSKVVSSLRGVSDKTAAQHKIVIEFKGTSARPPSTIEDLATRIGEYIKTRLKKSPLDCKVYVNTYDRYKGHIEAGQRGTACHDARAQVDAKQVQPWEKVFCDAIESGQTEGKLQLGGSYAMQIDSR